MCRTRAVIKSPGLTCAHVVWKFDNRQTGLCSSDRRQLLSQSRMPEMGEDITAFRNNPQQCLDTTYVSLGGRPLDVLHGRCVSTVGTLVNLPATPLLDRPQMDVLIAVSRGQATLGHRRVTTDG